MVHKLKILESYADAILEGRKNFEVRLNDRGYNTGDLVEFKVLHHNGRKFTKHIVAHKTYRITYVHSGLGMQDNYVVFGIKEVTQ